MSTNDCPTEAAHGSFCWNERLTRDVERAKPVGAGVGWMTPVS